MSEQRLIDIKHLYDNADKNHGFCRLHVSEIDALPTIEPPVVRGHWIVIGHYPPLCSNCDGIAPKDANGEDFYKSDFCQSCGADMRGANE